MLYGPNTNTGSILTMLEMQADYVLGMLARMEREDLSWLEVRADVMDAYNATLQEGIAKVAAWHEVGSRYYRHESGRIVTQFPGNMTAFRTMLETPDDDAYLGGAVREPVAAAG
jgi:cyclohexanone monooxygenase